MDRRPRQIAPPRIRRRFAQGPRQPGVKRAGPVEADLGDRASQGVVHPGDAGVGDPDQRHAFLDRPDAGAGTVLVRTGAVSEPGVIGQVEQEVRPRAVARHDPAGEDRLVADQGACRPETRDFQTDASRPRREVRKRLEERRQRQPVTQRQILAEGDQVRLVVPGRDGAAVVDDQHRVEDPRAGPVTGRRPPGFRRSARPWSASAAGRYGYSGRREPRSRAR